MSRKYFIFALAAVILSTFFLCHPERRKSLSLEELRNPKSPSYVPIPYPKTDEEIKTDVEYVLKYLFSPTKKELKKYSHSGKSKGTILMNWYGEILEVKIGGITKVKTHVDLFPEDYALLIDLVDTNGKVASKMCFEASGIWLQSRYFDEKNRALPYETEKEIREIFLSKLPDKLKPVEIIHLEPGIYSYNSDFGSFIKPVWEIKTNTDIFYLETSDFDLYKFIKKISTIGLLPLSEFPQGETIIKEFVECNNIQFHLEDSANAEILGLEKITKDAK